MRIGILYPGTDQAEDEYEELAARLDDVEVRIASTETDVSHELVDLRRAGGADRLVEGVRTLLAFEPHVVAWACTSGSFVFGLEGSRTQVAGLKAQTKGPCTSTSLAFLAALDQIGARRLAVVSPYPSETSGMFQSFLEEDGREVVNKICLGMPGGSDSAGLTPHQLHKAAATLDTREADALIIPDTAVRSVDVIGPLEEEVGKPVLTANQVTMWEAVRLGNGEARAPALGRLFA